FNLPLGNYKKPKLLYCSNGGYFLRILPDGTVDGTKAILFLPLPVSSD
nr:fibroblast growth factor,acidic [Bos taurus]